VTAGVISSVGLHTDSEFKAFTPAEGYNKNVTYKNGDCMHTLLPCNCNQTSSAAPFDKQNSPQSCPRAQHVVTRML